MMNLSHMTAPIFTLHVIPKIIKNYRLSLTSAEAVGRGEDKLAVDEGAPALLALHPDHHLVSHLAQ